MREVFGKEQVTIRKLQRREYLSRGDQMRATEREQQLMTLCLYKYVILSTYHNT